MSWEWDFGDGNSAAVQNPNYTYAAAGTYTVTLTVTDDVGATDALTQNVLVVEMCLDADNDGVPDEKDVCPDTPVNKLTDSEGCTAKQTSSLRKSKNK